MPRYGRGASKSVERAMHKRKKGTLKSGRSGRTVKSRKQAIAIGLSEAREKGAKVPSRGSRKSSRKSTSRKGASRKSASRKSTSRKSTSRKSTSRQSTSRRRTSGRKQTARKKR